MRYHEILEYETKKKQEITFKAEQDIKGDKNRGWKIDKLTAYVDGKDVGYIKIENIPKERYEQYYPTIVNYVSQISGTHILPIGKGHLHWKELETEDLRRSVKTAYWAILHKDYSVNEEFKKLPREDLEKMMDDIILPIKKRYGKQYKEFVDHHVDKPFVSYIFVEKDVRRQRIGVALYLTAAKWLKKQGLRLYASVGQSDEAKATWQYLEKHYNVKKDGDRRYLDV
ncbi:hypothetical protein LCGC14_1235280 [marine sediment metagenome]|uniref:N-acetyltransferase domain-containing protein n=1 Tax=marine sediment metagenome TaxID=412755 RepID=A0A0F9PBN8_9ZZZZ